ncbi:MAG TPA: sensor domain-containing diguanylate cyclase, partial [bacterium]|nr:sensor domain-containing diguanylate cyclase [bacterium]
MTGQEKKAMDKVRHEKKLLQQELFMFHRVMEGMRKDLSYEEVLKLIVKSATEGLGYDRAGLFDVDFKGRTVKRLVGIDAKGRFEYGFIGKSPIYPRKGYNVFSDLAYGYLHYFFSNNLTKRMPDAVKVNHVDQGVTANANVPIKVGKGRVIGILAVDNLFSQRRLKKADVVSLLNFATQAGLAMESARFHERVKNQTLTDGLTGVFNRRHFDLKLPQEMRRCALGKKPLGLLYVDIDHFKSINDRFGHLEGDEVLKWLAGLLGQGVRGADTVARIGGEEFAVIMPDTSASRVVAVAE